MALQCQEKRDINITVIRSRKKIGKTIYLDENDKKKSDYDAPPLKSECFTKSLSSLEEFMQYIEQCQADKYYSYSFTYGITDYDKFTLASEPTENIEKKEIARNDKNYKFKGRGILFIDVDKSEAPPEELYQRLLDALPELKNVKFAWRPSSNSFILNNKTGEYIHKYYGHRFYAIVEDMTNLQKFSKNLMTRLSANQLNFVVTSNSLGIYKTKCIFDDMAKPSRMDIISHPTVKPPLIKQHTETIYFGKDHTITNHIIKSSAISVTILKQVKKIVIKKPKNKYTVAELREKHGQENYEKLKNDILPDKHLLYLQTGETILAEDWSNYIGSRLCDPVEPTYNNDKRIAIIYDNGTIYSHAHGGTIYHCPQRIVKPRQYDKKLENNNNQTHSYTTNLQNSCQDLKKIFIEHDKQSLIIAPAGLGKTKAMIEFIVENPNLKIGIAVQNDKMAQQIAEDLKAYNIEPLVYKGLEKSCTKYSSEETSKMIEILSRLHIHQNSFSQNICVKGKKGYEEYCVNYETCPYQAQKRQTRNKKVVIFSQQLLFMDSILTSTGSPITFDYLFIDEDPFTSKAKAKTIKTDDPEINIAFKCLKEKTTISNSDKLKKMSSKEKNLIKQQYVFINDIIRPNVNIYSVIKALQEFMRDFKADKKLIKTIEIILDKTIKKYITNDLSTLEYISPIEIKILYEKLIILDATPFIDIYKKILPDIKPKHIICKDGNSPINILIKANNKTKNDIYTMTTLKKDETIDIILKVTETAQRQWGGNVGVITTLQVSKRLSELGLNALHYGCRGINSFENLDVLILAGRIMQTENDLRQLANYVYDDEIDPTDLKGLAPSIKIVNNQKISYYELKHPKLLEIANNFIMQTVTQAKERMRTLRGNENRLCIFLGVPIIDSYEYDYVLDYEEFVSALFKKC